MICTVDVWLNIEKRRERKVCPLTWNHISTFKCLDSEASPAIKLFSHLKHVVLIAEDLIAALRIPDEILHSCFFLEFTLIPKDIGFKSHEHKATLDSSLPPFSSIATIACVCYCQRPIDRFVVDQEAYLWILTLHSGLSTKKASLAYVFQKIFLIFSPFCFHYISQIVFL